MGKAVLITGARLSYPYLFRPRVGKNNQAGKFGCVLIVPKGSPCLTNLATAMREVAIEKWRERGHQMFEAIAAQDMLCMRDGDRKYNKDGSKADEYAGSMYISANSSNPPAVTGPDNVQLAESSGKPYAGCYVDAVVGVWAQENENGLRLNAEIRVVQFMRDGDAFTGSGAPASPDEIAALKAGTVPQAAPAPLAPPAMPTVPWTPAGGPIAPPPLPPLSSLV